MIGGPWAAAVAVPAGVAVLAAALAILGSARARRPPDARPGPTRRSTAKIHRWICSGPANAAFAPSRWAAWARMARGRSTVGGGCGRSRGRRRRGARAPGVGGASGAGRGVAGARGRTRGSGRRPPPQRRRRPASCAIPPAELRVPARRVIAFRLTPLRAVAAVALVAAVAVPLAAVPAGVPTAPGRGRTVRAGRRRRRVSPAQRRGRARRGGRRAAGARRRRARRGQPAPASSSRTRTAGRACSPGPTVARRRRSGWSATGSCAGPGVRHHRDRRVPGRVTAGRRRPRRRGGGRRSAPTARCGCVRTPTRRVPSAALDVARLDGQQRLAVTLPPRRHDPGARPARRSPDRAARARRGPADRLRRRAAGDADPAPPRGSPRPRWPGPAAARPGPPASITPSPTGSGDLVRARGRRRRPARPPRPERGEHRPDGPGRAARER